MNAYPFDLIPSLNCAIYILLFYGYRQNAKLMLATLSKTTRHYLITQADAVERTVELNWKRVNIYKHRITLSLSTNAKFIDIPSKFK